MQRSTLPERVASRRMRGTFCSQRRAHIKYSSIENWSRNVYNLNTKKALVYAKGTIEWFNGNMGSCVTMLYPSSVCSAGRPLGISGHRPRGRRPSPRHRLKEGSPSCPPTPHPTFAQNQFQKTAGFPTTADCRSSRQTRRKYSFYGHLRRAEF